MADNLPAERKPSYAAVTMEDTGGGGMLLPKTFGDVVAFAAVMARADIALPKHLRQNDGACLAVAMQALRWEMDPFAVANKSYSVNDRLAYEAQLVAAVVHTRAPIARRPDYAFTGEGVTRRCIVSIEMLDGTTKAYESPEFGKITTKNSPLWKSDPDQQLGYFAIRSWARRHAPEVILGVYTPDELIDNRHADAPKVTGVLERLRSNEEARPEGFSAARAIEDAATIEPAEVIEAEVSEIDAVLEGDTIPDFPAPEGPAEPQGAPPEAEQSRPQETVDQTSGPPLADRIVAFKQRVTEATTTLKLKSIHAASAKLRSDADKSDPESLIDLEGFFDTRYAVIEDAEREAKKVHTHADPAGK